MSVTAKRCFAIRAIVALAVILSCGVHAVDDAELDSAIRNLGHAKSKQRQLASAFLWTHGAAALSRLETAAKSDDPEIRKQAQSLVARVTLGVKPGASKEVIAFAETCFRADAEERRAMIRSASDLPEILTMIPHLFPDKDDANEAKRLMIIKLGEGEHVDAVLPVLKDQEEDDYVRSIAAYVVGEKKYLKSIPHMVAILAETRIRYRSGLCLAVKEALEKLGKDGVAGISDGIKATKDGRHRANLVWALMRSGAEEAIPMLTQCLKDEDLSVRSHAISALQQVEGKPAAPKLLPFLDDPKLSGDAKLALEKLAGRSFDDAAACKVWWKSELRKSAQDSTSDGQK